MSQYRKANTKAAAMAKAAEMREAIEKGKLKVKGIRVSTEMKSHEVPSKRHTKQASKASPAWHLASVRGAPGGAGKSGYSIMKMVQAEHTGTRVVKIETAEGKALMVRLGNSARNANTTSTTTDARTKGLIK